MHYPAPRVSQFAQIHQKSSVSTLIGLMILGTVGITPPAAAVPVPSCDSAAFTPGVEVECVVPGTIVGAIATFDLVAIGAGGGVSNDDSDGGNGAHVSGRLSVAVGSSIFVTVGAAGGTSSTPHGGGSGGGSTGAEDATGRLLVEAGGGGGAGGGWVCLYDNRGGSGGGADGVGGAASESCPQATYSLAAGGSAGVGGAGGVGKFYEEGSWANGNPGLAGTGGAGANGTNGDLNPVTYPSSSFALVPASVVAGGLGYHAGGASGMAMERPAGDGLVNAARANGGGGGGGGYGGGGGGWSEISCYDSDGHCQESMTGAGGGGGSFADASVISAVAFRSAGSSDGYGLGGYTPEGSSVPAQDGTFSLTAVPGAPEVQTQAAATSVTTSTAVVRSAVNALGGGDATVVIEASASSTMSSPTVVSTSPSTVLSTGGVVTIEGSISGLAAGTTLYYRTTAANAAGTTVGAVESFTTTTDSGAGGGGGSGGSPATTPVAAATPTPTPPPVSSDPLNPVSLLVNPAIPAGGLPAGQSLLLSDGQQVPVTVRPNAASDPVALVVNAPSLTPPLNMRLEGRGDESDPLGLTSKQALVLQSQIVRGRSLRAKTVKVQPVAQSSGDGFKATSPVKFYLLPSTYLGELITDANGVYKGSVPIPAGIKPGVYTLQANGFAPDDSVRSLSIGVLVKPTQVAVRPAVAKASVFFDSLIPEITAAGKASLRGLVTKTGLQAITVRSIGFVQPTGTTSNDQTLSTARARNVAAYLRSLGVRGVYVVRGDGRDSATGAKARRVDVTITYPRR